MRLLARYTGCTVIGIDYSLSPQARYPQAIEETVAVCSYFSQHADEYSLNVENRFRRRFRRRHAGACQRALAT